MMLLFLWAFLCNFYSTAKLANCQATLVYRTVEDLLTYYHYFMHLVAVIRMPAS